MSAGLDYPAAAAVSQCHSGNNNHLNGDSYHLKSSVILIKVLAFWRTHCPWAVHYAQRAFDPTRCVFVQIKRSLRGPLRKRPKTYNPQMIIIYNNNNKTMTKLWLASAEVLCFPFVLSNLFSIISHVQK